MTHTKPCENTTMTNKAIYHLQLELGKALAERDKLIEVCQPIFNRVKDERCKET